MRIAWGTPFHPRSAIGLHIFENVKNIDFDDVRKLLLHGQGSSPSGAEFDSLMLLIGTADTLLREAVKEPPESVRTLEGWMLGL